MGVGRSGDVVQRSLCPHSGLSFDEADSAHEQIVQVCLADGSVRLISVNIDLRPGRTCATWSQGSPVNMPQ